MRGLYKHSLSPGKLCSPQLQQLAITWPVPRKGQRLHGVWVKVVCVNGFWHNDKLGLLHPRFCKDADVVIGGHPYLVQEIALLDKPATASWCTQVNQGSLDG